MLLKFNNQTHSIDLSSIQSFASLQQLISESTAILPINQKLIVKGKVISSLNGLLDSDIILLIGIKPATALEISNENLKLAKRFNLPKGVAYSSNDIKSTFFSAYEVLTSFKDHEQARNYLVIFLSNFHI